MVNAYTSGLTEQEVIKRIKDAQKRRFVHIRSLDTGEETRIRVYFNCIAGTIVDYKCLEDAASRCGMKRHVFRKAVLGGDYDDVLPTGGCFERCDDGPEISVYFEANIHYSVFEDGLIGYRGHWCANLRKLITTICEREDSE